LDYPFDRLGWLEHEGHLRRKLLFLDLNFWINLSESKDSSYERLKALLSNQVETGKLICPVSPSLLMELLKRKRDTHRDTISQLMDELSKGLSLRDVDTTFRHEFEAALDGRQAERQAAYSRFQDVFPPQVFPLPFPESITDFMSGYWGDTRGIYAAGIEQGFSERAQQENELRRDNKLTWKMVEEAERQGTFREMKPVILRVLRALGYPLLSRKLRDILDSCPSFWCHYKYTTELRLHRRVKRNDMWDFLHAAMAVPYVDCLAADGGIRHICADVLKMDKKFGTRIISLSQGPGLIDWLQGV
jgi:hypothetical protein